MHFSEILKPKTEAEKIKASVIIKIRFTFKKHFENAKQYIKIFKVMSIYILGISYRVKLFKQRHIERKKAIKIHFFSLDDTVNKYIYLTLKKRTILQIIEIIDPERKTTLFQRLH